MQRKDNGTSTTIPGPRVRTARLDTIRRTVPSGLARVGFSGLKHCQVLSVCDRNGECRISSHRGNRFGKSVHDHLYLLERKNQGLLEPSGGLVMDRRRLRISLLAINLWQCPEEILPKGESLARRSHGGRYDTLTTSRRMCDCKPSQFYAPILPDFECFNFNPAALGVRR